MQKVRTEVAEPEILTSTYTSAPTSVSTDSAPTSYMENKVAAKSVLFDKKEEDDKPFIYRSPFEKIKDEPKDKKDKK